MKTAFQYIRISNEDQSNFSLSGQEKMNQDYANKHGIHILKTFTDDGYSAKNFNRPQWKELETALSKNKNKVDYLIITKYDRLIRNAAEGLAFIEKLESKWNIKLLSVMENFFIDPHSPFFFKLRADLLVTAEFERRVISDRTKFGVWSAKSQGRFIGVAPFGYDNARDEKDKPIIIINDSEKETVKQIFNDFLNGVSFPLIIRKAKLNGFTLNGHDALTRLLSNHVYAGLLIVPSYKDEPQKIVKASHEPIIDEDTFWKSYYMLNDKIKPQGPKVIDENLPLRGFLLCPSCEKHHTGGKSKGKLNYYYYYWCKRCKNQMYNAEKVHEWLTEILNGLSLKTEYVRALKIETEKQFEEAMKDRANKLKKVEKDYTELSTKINSLEEKYINDKIQHETYVKWHSTFSRDLNGKRIELQELTKNENDVWRIFENNLQYLTDINWIYNQASTEDKQPYLKHIFPGFLTKEKQGGRTPYLNKMFECNLQNIKHLIRVERMGELTINANSPVCSPNGIEIEHFLRCIDKILKVA